MQNPEEIRTSVNQMWSEEWLRNAKPHHDIIVEFMADKLKPGMNILDIGERNPLTEWLEERNGVKIDSTLDDLDNNNWANDFEWGYDIIICSHVIEHLFNPLSFLNQCKWLLNTDGRLYIITPVKPYWITPAKCHFHEMNHRNMKRLIDRAEFRIMNWQEYSVPIPFRFSLRNWLRRLYKEYSIITLTK